MSIIIPRIPRRENFNYVLKSVKSDGYNLRNACDKLKNNYDIVLEAVKNDGSALYYASNNLKDNYYIVLESVKDNGNNLQYASDNLKNNYNIVLQAVKDNKHNHNDGNATEGYALKFASDNLKNNYNIVLEGVKNNDLIIDYASENLQKNHIIILESIKNINWGTGLKYIIKYNLRNNYNFILAIIEMNDNKVYNILKEYINNDIYIKIYNCIINKKYNLNFIIKNLWYKCPNSDEKSQKCLIKYKHIKKYLIKNKNKLINKWSLLCNKKYIISNIDILEKMLNIKFIDITLF
jgi:hypothetical protein